MFRQVHAFEKADLSHYVAATIAVVLSVIVRLLLDPLMGADLPYGPLFVAIAFGSWYGGIGPAILGACLGYVPTEYFFVQPRYTLFRADEVQQIASLLVYSAVDASIIYFTYRMRVSERQARTGEEAAKRLAAEMERLSRVKDEFLSSLSHELRTPLNAILGWTQLLKKTINGHPQIRDSLDIIERNAKTQALLIEDLLDLSRMTTGKIALRIEETDLAELILRAVEIVTPLAKAKEIELSTAIACGSVFRVKCDPHRLQQVVWNLLTNAVKFTPEHGKIEIGLRMAGPCLEIRVIDNGEGIESSFLPHLFEKFSQFEPASGQKHQGLGIGLSIVRHLVEMHGGTVRAMSQGRGQGATFIVSLPGSLLVGQADTSSARLAAN